jgi:accessory gene regulator B
MNNLALFFTNYIIKKGVIEKKDFSIYYYGFLCVSETFVNILYSVIIALVLDMKSECLLFFLFFVPLRSYNGGLHMKNYYSCLILSCFTLTIVLFTVKNYTISSNISLILFLISLLMIKIIGAVSHPNRPVEEGEEKYFKKKANNFMILSILFALIFIACSQEQYLFLEALVFVLVSITSLVEKLKSLAQ